MAASDIIDFRGERNRHRGFVAREDVLAEIDRLLWEGDPQESRWVLVTGKPGMGKSALLSVAGENPPGHVRATTMCSGSPGT